MIGKSFKFTWKVAADKWHHQGTKKVGASAQDIDELWERVP